MLRNIALALAGAALSISAPLGAAETATASFTLTLRVPVLCTVRHRPIGVAVSGDTANLGELDEYCNAPQGYELTVDYMPAPCRGPSSSPVTTMSSSTARATQCSVAPRARASGHARSPPSPAAAASIQEV